MRFALILSILATPVFAQTPIDGDRFEALVTGQTLTYSNAFGPYGVEYYAPNRQVIWSFLGADCETGEWYEEATNIGPSICFVYESQGTPQCWHVYEEGGKIRADFVGSAGRSVLYQLEQSEPLVCGGAGV